MVSKQHFMRVLFSFLLQHCLNHAFRYYCFNIDAISSFHSNTFVSPSRISIQTSPFPSHACPYCYLVLVQLSILFKDLVSSSFLHLITALYSSSFTYYIRIWSTSYLLISLQSRLSLSLSIKVGKCEL